jgi:hypothetical protein
LQPSTVYLAVAMSDRPPDTSLAWCLERLATEKLTRGIMTALIEDLCPNRDLSIPDHLKLRILLQDLELQHEIADDTLEVLQNIQDTLLNTEDGSLASSEYMYPPPELLLQVKMQIVASTWQGSDAPPKSADIIEKIIRAFGQPAHHEEKAYDELIKAAGDVTYRPEIDAKVAKFATLAGIHRYAAWAKQHLGPVVLQIICKDINDGVYFPGYRPPITRQTEPLRASGLKEARAALRSAGGEDPLQQAYAKAALATQGKQQELPNNQNHRDVTPAAAIIAGAGTDTVDAVIRREVATSPPPRIRTSDSPVIPSNGEELLGYRVQELGRKSLPSGLGGHRMKIWWSPQEEAALIEACRACQPGHWAEIKSRYGKEGQPLQNRDPMDLKDKWRNLLRAGNAMALQIHEEHALRDKFPEAKAKKVYETVDNNVMLENLLKSTAELQRRVQIIESGNKKAKSIEEEEEEDAGLRVRTRAAARKNPTPREDDDDGGEDAGLRVRTRAAARKNPTPREVEEEEGKEVNIPLIPAARKNPMPREIRVSTRYKRAKKQ